MQSVLRFFKKLHFSSYSVLNVLSKVSCNQKYCQQFLNSPSVHGGLLCPGSRFSARGAIKGRSFKTCCYDIVVIFVPY